MHPSVRAHLILAAAIKFRVVEAWGRRAVSYAKRCTSLVLGQGGIGCTKACSKGLHNVSKDTLIASCCATCGSCYPEDAGKLRLKSYSNFCLQASACTISDNRLLYTSKYHGRTQVCVHHVSCPKPSDTQSTVQGKIMRAKSQTLGDAHTVHIAQVALSAPRPRTPGAPIDFEGA